MLLPIPPIESYVPGMLLKIEHVPKNIAEGKPEADYFADEQLWFTVERKDNDLLHINTSRRLWNIVIIAQRPELDASLEVVAVEEEVDLFTLPPQEQITKAILSEDLQGDLPGVWLRLVLSGERDLGLRLIPYQLAN